MGECLQKSFSRKKREAVLNYVKGLESIFDKNGKQYVYKLSHTYDISPSPLYVKSSILPEAMDLLLAYMQFKLSNIEEGYALGQEEITPILSSLYETAELPKQKKFDYEFDLYINWEQWCGIASQVEEIELFDREELDELLREIVK